MAGICDECTCANEDQEKIKLMEAEIARLRGLVASASGMLLDAGMPLSAEKLLEQIFHSSNCKQNKNGKILI